MNATLKLTEAKNNLPTISTLIKKSDFFKEWDGKQKSQIPTTNSRIRKYKEDGKDSIATLIDYKQLRKYDSKLYFKLLEKGITYEHQGYIIHVKHDSRMNGTFIFDNYGTHTKEYIDTYKARINQKELLFFSTSENRKAMLNAWNHFNKDLK